MEVYERIDMVLKNNGLSRTQFACGIDNVSQSTINRQLSGQTPLTAQVISELLKAYPAISAQWLLTGEGDMLKPPASSVSATSSGANSPAIAAGGNIENCGNGPEDNEGYARVAKELEEMKGKLDELIETSKHEKAELIAILKQVTGK